MNDQLHQGTRKDLSRRQLKLRTTSEGETELKTKLIEIKARKDDLDAARDRVNAMGVRMQGTYRQIDTYFNVSSGRLKLREVDGEDASKLVYYDREDVQDPKQSDVNILETRQTGTLKSILESSLGVMVTVEKTREIYHHEGTQIHLDIVDGLGRFVEFERPITDIEADREVLRSLMRALEIEQNDLLTRSYSDLKLEQRT